MGDFYKMAQEEATFIQADVAFEKENYKKAIQYFEEYAALCGIENLELWTVNSWALSYYRQYLKEGENKKEE